MKRMNNWWQRNNLILQKNRISYNLYKLRCGGGAVAQQRKRRRECACSNFQAKLMVFSKLPAAVLKVEANEI